MFSLDWNMHVVSIIVKFPIKFPCKCSHACLTTSVCCVSDQQSWKSLASVCKLKSKELTISKVTITATGYESLHVSFPLTWVIRRPSCMGTPLSDKVNLPEGVNPTSQLRRCCCHCECGLTLSRGSECCSLCVILVTWSCFCWDPRSRSLSDERECRSHCDI